MVMKITNNQYDKYILKYGYYLNSVWEHVLPDNTDVYIVYTYMLL